MAYLPRPLAILLLAVLAGCVPNESTAPHSTADEPAVFHDSGPNARFGQPSLATAVPSHREDLLVERPQYVLSYNAKTHGPNWVSWRLRQSDVGNAARAAFEPDPLLPKGFAHVTSHAYDGSGFDR